MQTFGEIVHMLLTAHDQAGDPYVVGVDGEPGGIKVVSHNKHVVVGKTFASGSTIVINLERCGFLRIITK